MKRLNKYPLKKLSDFFIILGILSVVIMLEACGEEEGDVTVLVESIEIEGNYITDGGSSQMIAVISPENASNKEISWSVSDENVATIDANGLLTTVSYGTVTVIATAQDGSGVTGTRLIGVSGPVPVESIEIVGPNTSDGSSETYTVTITPVNASVKDVEWSVSDQEIATIDSTGFLTPLKNGTVTITAAATDGSDVTGELEITISGVDENLLGVVVSTPAELIDAIGRVQPGENIYIRAGNYPFNGTIVLNKSGQENNMISLLAYPSDTERPVLDFSAMSESSSNRGVSLSGDYWHIKGIDIYNAGDNGMNISGNNNLIEFCAFYENSDSGLQIGNGGANNTVINCDSYYNADSSIENADGFAAKLDCGSGNKFIGCRAWNNLDDGWDGYLRGADNVDTYYENCWAIRNGYLKNGTVGGGDGNGFKTGGSDDKRLKHNAQYRNCIAAGNVVDGFDHNSNRGDVLLYNCGAYQNGRNISFGSSNIANSLIIKNTASLQGNNNDRYEATSTDVTNNSWQNGLSATTADYVSLNIDLLLAPRKPDGSLPDVDFMKLQSGSDLINAGVDVGLEYNGIAPDIGPFEFEN